uniref:Uncharacterized protein n=1 Tax=Rhizophora mucronata TaxID=61149 RepID=A0A2P2R3S8_RHIMU
MMLHDGRFNQITTNIVAVHCCLFLNSNQIFQVGKSSDNGAPLVETLLSLIFSCSS